MPADPPTTDKPIADDTVRGRQEADTIALSVEMAQRVIEDYLALFETRAPAPGHVADAGQLPHSKQTIRSAVKLCLQHGRGRGADRDSLKTAFVSLAFWQDGVGEELLALHLLRPAGPGGATRVQPASASAARDRDVWNVRVVDELNRLSREWWDMGFVSTN